VRQEKGRCAPNARADNGVSQFLPVRAAAAGVTGLGRRWWFILVWAAVALTQNLIHEGVHYGAALVCGEPVAEVRLFTNGFGTSQVVLATPVAERIGAHWLVIAWLPAVATVAIGYLIYLYRERLVRRGRPVASVAAWYAGIIFLLLDPFYYAVLSVFTGGDVQAAAAVGWSPWPVRLAALVVFGLNLRLILRWARELQASYGRG